MILDCWIFSLILFITCSTLSLSECPQGHGKKFGEHVDFMKLIEEIREVPSPETFYSQYCRKSRPIVIRGVAKDWPALTKWTNMSYLLEQNNFGRDLHTVNWHGLHGYDVKHNQALQIPFSEFIERMKAGENIYLDSTLPWRLWKDVNWPRFIACDWWIKQLKQVAIFFNSGKSNSAIHMDATETIFIQISGQRRWILIPPNNTDLLYAGPRYHSEHLGISRVDISRVDLKRDVDLSKADLFVTDLNPGDMIYVPETWYHQVSTKHRPNIAVAVFVNILLCNNWFKKGNITDKEHVERCRWLLNNLPKEIKCAESPEKDMLRLDDLKKKYPLVDGFEVCTKHCSSQICSSTLKRHLIHVYNSEHRKVLFPIFGLSLFGMRKDILMSRETFKIVNNSYDDCNRVLVVSPEDNSVNVLGNIYKELDLRKKKVYRIVLEISFEYISAEEDKGRDLITIVDDALSILGKNRVDLLLLRAPFCDPPQIINTTAGCERDLWPEEGEQWLPTWRKAEYMWEAGRVMSLGVKDMTLKEVRHLHKTAKPYSLSVIGARVDPFFRNSALREFGNEHNIQIMAHGLLGGHYVRKGMGHPAYTSHTALKGAFSSAVTVYTSAMDWALKRNIMAAPRVKSYWEARWIMRVFSVQFHVDQNNNAEALDSLIPSDPMNKLPMRHPILDETSRREKADMQSFETNQSSSAKFTYIPENILERLKKDLNTGQDKINVNKKKLVDPVKYRSEQNKDEL